MEFDKTRSIWA